MPTGQIEPEVQVILASSSPYRRMLIERLRLTVQAIAPEIDESTRPGERATDYVARLARAKAQRVAEVLGPALEVPPRGVVVVGSDQCAVLDEVIIGKPGEHDAAVAQLTAAAGRTVRFETGVAVLRQIPGDQASEIEVDVVPYEVTFRRLEPAEIERYVAAEKPYDCAGGFKSEGLGITLFERMHGPDPTALVGLPLIRLGQMLRQAGLQMP